MLFITLSVTVQLFMNAKGVSDNFTIYSQTASWFAKDLHLEKQLLVDSSFSAQHSQPATTSPNKRALRVRLFPLQSAAPTASGL